MPLIQVYDISDYIVTGEGVGVDVVPVPGCLIHAVVLVEMDI